MTPDVPSHCPLNDAHCAALDKVIQSNTNALKLVKDCKDCGLPVEEYEQGLQAQLDLARKLKAKFFPHRP